MTELAILLHMKRDEFRNRIARFREQSALKMAVIVVFGTAVWSGLYWLFHRGFVFIQMQEWGGPLLSQYLMLNMLSLFFFSLTMMLVFSNGIILYGSLYRSRETAFLVTSPLRPVTLLLYRLGESVVFSSWAFLFLVTPLMVAYARTQGLGARFYGASFAYFLAFIFIPASLGALAAIGITAFFPRSKRAVLLLLGGLAAVAVVAVATNLLSLRRLLHANPEASAFELFQKIAFLQHVLMPNYWVAQGVVDLGKPEGGQAAVFFRLIVANALFLTMGAVLAAKAFLMRGWWASQGMRAGRRYRDGGFFWRRIAGPCLAPIGHQLRLLVIKDLKNFLRDPVQWSQFLIFFGLLMIYFANLRSFRYNQKEMYWKNLIAQLNLAATCLTLSTFTSRFVYPQLSLEGRRFWIIGMVPMTRTRILVGKFFFSCAGALAVCLTLVVISNWMLEIPREVMGLQVLSVTGACVGLSGLAVGLGAIYPNFTEDNPSKIVSGFGGTLNLVLSLLLVVTVVALEAFPSTLHLTGRIRPQMFSWLAIAAGTLIVLVSAVAAVVPFWLGARNFEKLEA